MKKLFYLLLLSSSLNAGIPTGSIIFKDKGFSTVEMLEAGQNVLSFNGKLDKPKFSHNKIHVIAKSKVKSLYLIKTSRGEIRLSKNHLVYDGYKRAWIAAKKVNIYSALVDAQLKLYEVTSVEKIRLDKHIFVYDFLVEEDTCYFMADSSGNKILVHNGWPEIAESARAWGSIILSAYLNDPEKSQTIRRAAEGLTFLGVAAAGTYQIGRQMRRQVARPEGEEPASSISNMSRQERYAYARSIGIDERKLDIAESEAEEYCRAYFPGDSQEERTQRLNSEIQKRAKQARPVLVGNRIVNVNVEHNFAAKRIIDKLQRIDFDRYGDGNVIYYDPQDHDFQIFHNQGMDDKELLDTVYTRRSNDPGIFLYTDRPDVNHILLLKDLEEERESVSKLLETRYKEPKKPEDPKDFRDNSVEHVFTAKKGHLNRFEKAEKLLKNIANDDAAFKGTDKYGNEWYEAKEGESQYWVKVRDSKITGGGRNLKPLPWNPEKGFVK